MKAKDLAAILLDNPDAEVMVCNPDAEAKWYPVTGAIVSAAQDAIDLYSDEA